jgi:hypothetical protein
MSPVVGFVILTGLASLLVLGLGLRTNLRGRHAHHGESHTEHGHAYHGGNKAA